MLPLRVFINKLHNENIMKNNRLKLAILLCLLSSLVLTGCGGRSVEFDAITFNRKWTAWEAQGIVDYSMYKQWDMGGGILLTVEENAITQALQNHPDGWVELQEWGVYLRTISELYVWIDTQYRRLVAGNGGVIRITYNEDFNFPEFISIGFRSSFRIRPKIGGSSPEFVFLSEFVPLTSTPEKEGENYEK